MPVWGIVAPTSMPLLAMVACKNAELRNDSLPISADTFHNFFSSPPGRRLAAVVDITYHLFKIFGITYHWSALTRPCVWLHTSRIHDRFSVILPIMARMMRTAG